MAYLLKINYDGTLRRVPVQCRTGATEPDLTYFKLESKIREIFQIPSNLRFSITYKDKDNDEVTICEDQDIDDALVTQGLNPLRLDVSLKIQNSRNRSIEFDENTQLKQNLQDDGENRSYDNEKYIQIDQTPLNKAPENYPLKKESTVCQGKLEACTNYEDTEDVPLGSMPSNSFVNLPNCPINDLDFSNNQPFLGDSNSSVDFSRALFSENSNAMEENPIPTSGFLPFSFELEEPHSALQDFVNLEHKFDSSKDSAVSVGESKHRMLNHSIHEGVSCDLCRMLPIIGLRFKSSRKHDFDLCGKCYNNINDKDEYYEVKLLSQSKIISPLASFLHNRSITGNIPFNVSDKISSATDESAHNSIHEDVRCDSCSMRPIIGLRFKSSRKDNFDLCGKCYNNIRYKDEYFQVNTHPQSKIASSVASFQQSGRSSNTISLNASNKDPFATNVQATATTTSASHAFGATVHKHILKGRLNCQVVMDVTVPEGTTFPTGTRFRKTWLLKNTGKDPWPPGTKLARVAGDYLGMQVAVIPELLDGVPRESEVNASIDLVAPAEPGHYACHWRLMVPSQEKFGSLIWVLIKVLKS